MIGKRNEAERALQTGERTWRKVAACREARSRLKKAIEHAKKNWLAEKVDELHDMSINPATAWSAAREIIQGYRGHHKKSDDHKVQNADGTFAETDQEKADAEAKYFHGYVFGIQSPFDQAAVDNVSQREEDNSLGHKPTLREVIQAIKRAKRRKSPGTNGISVELFQKMNDKNLETVHYLLGRYWLEPDFDCDDWHKIKLKLIAKKGDLSLPKNWRPIALLDVFSKLLSSIIAQRLGGHLKLVGLKEQSGFMPSHGCVDATATLKATLQSMKDSNQDAYVLFVDLVKAFDSVNREMLWQILAKFGIPVPLVTVIMKMYADIEVSTSVGNAKATFPSTSGVKQGDNLAPVLFLFAIQAAAESMSKNWSFDKPDLTVTSKSLMNERDHAKTGHISLDFNRSFYADDAAFVFLSRAELIEGSTFLTKEFARFGLTVHLGTKEPTRVTAKTEAMHIPARGTTPEPTATADYDVLDNGRFISFCDSFRYLGTQITPDLDETFEIDTRIRAATKAFMSMKDIFFNKKIDLKTRKQLYLQIPLNIVLWGCDSSALKSSHIAKLTAFHHKCARWLVNVTRWDCRFQHITMKSILHDLELPTMEQIIHVRILRFLEKVAHMPGGRLTREVLRSQARPVGAIKKGRKQTSTRSSYVRTLRAAGLLDKTSKDSGGAYHKWMHRFGQRDIGLHIDENLGLEAGTYHGKRRNTTRI
jgi:hypothetical protein